MKVWTWVAGGLTLAAVGAVAGFGIAAHEELSQLTHTPPYQLQSAPEPMVPATPSPIDDASLTTTLATLAENPDLGVFHGHVTSIGSGAAVFDRASEEALRPASVTKVLTASAALLSLGAQDRITTEVVRGADPAAVTIKAAGDVWLDAQALDTLAEQIGHADAVYIDTSIWDGMEEMLPGWNPLDIDGGYVAPMQPAMLSGGRLDGETTGDVPRSHTPALDVAQALAGRVGAQTVGIGTAEGDVVAAVESPTLVERLELMMKHSDNVYAEAIGREVALARETMDAPGATLSVLEERGFNTAGVVLRDNSGLSTEDRICLLYTSPSPRDRG